MLATGTMLVKAWHFVVQSAVHSAVLNRLGVWARARSHPSTVTMSW